MSAPLTHALKKAGLAHAVMEVELMRRWADVVGTDMAKATWPEVIRDKVLVVACAHPAWKHELHFRQEEILKRANAVVGQGAVASLGTVLRSPRSGGASELVPRPEAEAFGSEISAPVDDEVLRKTIRRAAAANAEARFRGRLA